MTHDGSLDIAVLYNSPQGPDLVSELLVEEKLVNGDERTRWRDVSKPDSNVVAVRHYYFAPTPDDAMDPAQYVYVDWGPSFKVNRQAAFPELGNPPVSISFGPLALTYLLSVDGSNCFRIGTAQPYLQNGRLRLVKDAPELSWSAYTVYARRQEGQVLDRVRHGLREVATACNERSQATTWVRGSLFVAGRN
ncbi:MAG: hypothetical protein AB1704_42445 [Pseudomonadota bacterium]